MCSSRVYSFKLYEKYLGICGQKRNRTAVVPKTVAVTRGRILGFYFVGVSFVFSGRLGQIGLKEGYLSAVKNISSVIGLFVQHAKEEGNVCSEEL